MTLNLTKNKFHNIRKGPLLLIIMDGIGIGKNADNNGVYLAKTPTLDKLFASPFYTKLKAHGPAVGLPSEDDMGNSEVGHNALGAGRVFSQGAKLVNNSIKSGNIFQSELWQKIISAGKNGSTIHFIGLFSDGNVHSHIDQLYALIDECVKNGVSKVRLHPLLDGRDVGERSALDYVLPAEEKFAKISSNNLDYKIASGGGRMHVTMDRYNADWLIVKRGWDAHVNGIGRKFLSASEAIKTYYDEDHKMTDQYMDAFVVVDNNGEPVGKINDGDCVIFYNFRGDRAIEISRAFDEKDFKEFDRGRTPNVLYAGMMEYDGDLHIPKNYLVAPPEIDNTISQYLVTDNVKMFAISETQKFGHVTYFWNGNKSGYIDKHLETYIEIPSDKIEFDKAPKMKAFEITEKVDELLKTGNFNFGRLNFANGDMVGHTGVMEAVITAVETVDSCVARLLKTIESLGGIALITADHGNADEMFTEKNGVRTPKTAHTLNPVPFVIFDPNYKNEYKFANVSNPGLSNVAATIFNLLGYNKPEDYDPSLIEL